MKKKIIIAALVLAVTVIGGLVPALYASGVNLNTHLKSGSNSEWRLFSFSIRELLVGVQISLSLALLTGVGLLINSMMFHVDVPIRWSSRDMAVVRAVFKPNPSTHLGLGTSPSGDARASYAMFFQEFQNRLSTTPEVSTAGIFKPIPFSIDAVKATQFLVAVFKTPRGGPEIVFEPVVEGRANAEGFEMMGISLIAGRHFSSIDMTREIEFQIGYREALLKGRTSARVDGVVIVSQSLARQFWPEENAIGKTIYAGGISNAYEIIGVVSDTHLVSDNKNIVPTVYYPPDSYGEIQTFIVKLHSGAFMKDFRQRLYDFDAGSAATIEVQSLGEIVSKATADTRMTLQLLGSFALLGIVVASLGVYATTSLMAAAWNREMGIRMAMGAQTWDILRLALWRGTRAIILGLPVGLFLAWILSRILAGYLFHVKTDAAFVWIASCALLFVITIVAAFIPALRVSRVNPLDALRNE
jgi:ABC-type antimicrobial peptide transport system permease subunit